MALALSSRLLVALAAIAAWGVAGGAAAQTIRESAQTAIRTNPRVEVVTNNRQAVEQELARARGQYYPQVDLRGGIGPEYTYNNNTRAQPGGGSTTLTRQEVGLAAVQRVCDGWETDSEVERQKARGLSAARRVGETSEALALDAIEAHIDVVRQRQLLRLAEENVEVHRSMMARVRQRARGGAAGTADIDQVQARLDTALATLAETRGALSDAENRYFYVVNQRPGQLAPAEMPAFAMPATLDDAIERARRQNRSIKVNDADVTVADREIDVADSSFYPKLNVELGGSLNNDLDGVKGSDNNAAALLVLRWNLFRGGSDIAQRRVALGRMSQAMAQRSVAFRQAEEETRRSWVALQTATDRLPSLQSAVLQNRSVRDAYTRQFFDLGQRSLIDVLNAENELFVSSGRLVSAQAAQFFAVYRLHAAMGELITQLALEVPPEGDEKRPAPIPEDPRSRNAPR
jgi:adhesin transport system outer membrane protein